MSDSTNLMQTEKALSRAAEMTANCRTDVAGRCRQLGDQAAAIKWGGGGATAFQNLMNAWQEKQRTILEALDQLSAALTETEKDNMSTDDAQVQAVSKLQNRLG